MQSWELEEWAAAFRIAPYGHDVTHRMLAQIACLIAAQCGVKDVEVEDMMPKVQRGDPEYMSEEDLLMSMPGGAEVMERIRKGELK